MLLQLIIQQLTFTEAWTVREYWTQLPLASPKTSTWWSAFKHSWNSGLYWILQYFKLYIPSVIGPVTFY